MCVYVCMYLWNTYVCFIDDFLLAKKMLKRGNNLKEKKELRKLNSETEQYEGGKRVQYEEERFAGKGNRVY